jgi:hypothetical protein
MVFETNFAFLFRSAEFLCTVFCVRLDLARAWAAIRSFLVLAGEIAASGRRAIAKVLDGKFSASG